MVNIANAYVATKFATSKNWFSDGLEALGIGNRGFGEFPILSMFGALLVIGSVLRRDLVRFLNHCLASSMLLLVILGCTEISENRGIHDRRNGHYSCYCSKSFWLKQKLFRSHWILTGYFLPVVLCHWVCY